MGDDSALLTVMLAGLEAGFHWVSHTDSTMHPNFRDVELGTVGRRKLSLVNHGEVKFAQSCPTLFDPLDYT